MRGAEGGRGGVRGGGVGVGEITLWARRASQAKFLMPITPSSVSVEHVRNCMQRTAIRHNLLPTALRDNCNVRNYTQRGILGHIPLQTKKIRPTAPLHDAATACLVCFSLSISLRLELHMPCQEMQTHRFRVYCLGFRD